MIHEPMPRWTINRVDGEREPIGAMTGPKGSAETWQLPEWMNLDHAQLLFEGWWRPDGPYWRPK